MRVFQSMIYTSLIERSRSNRFKTAVKGKNTKNVVTESSVRPSAIVSTTWRPDGRQCLLLPRDIRHEANVFSYILAKKDIARLASYSSCRESVIRSRSLASARAAARLSE